MTLPLPVDDSAVTELRAGVVDRGPVTGRLGGAGRVPAGRGNPHVLAAADPGVGVLLILDERHDEPWIFVAVRVRRLQDRRLAGAGEAGVVAERVAAVSGGVQRAVGVLADPVVGVGRVDDHVEAVTASWLSR